MYRSSCGTECVSVAQFCYQCGNTISPNENALKRDASAVDDNRTDGSGTAPLTFAQFRARKEEDRKGYFRSKRPKTAKRPRVLNQSDVNSEVKINIGVMTLKDGVLSIKRGIALPLTVPQCIGTDDLLGKAVDKHNRFNRDVIMSSNKAFYHLLYGDKNLVLTLPGSEEPFTLKRYKDEIDKPYSKITLYLCSCSDYTGSISLGLDTDSGSDLELSNVTPGFTCISTPALNNLRSTVEDEYQTRSSNLTATVTHCQSAIDLSCLEQEEGIVEDEASQSAGLATRQALPVEGTVSLDPFMSTPSEADMTVSLDEGSSSVSQGIIGSVFEMQDVGTGPTLPVTLHRAFLKNDILQLFKDPKILHYNLDIKITSLTGREEEGKGVGVIREVLTTFWNECFSSLTIGAIEKVPCVRHDYKRSEWEAIGRVLVYGYFVARFFPITLCRAFVYTLFFGEESLTPDCLLESFKLFISEEDRQVLDKSLGKDFDPNDDDLLEFLSSFKCYKSPTLDNIKTLMNELAFQEIVQKPRYIVDCLSPVLAALRVFPPFQTLNDLEQFYIAKKPSPKKVIKLLSADPQPGAEQNSFDYLKQYIKTLPSGELENFLQFLTGSNIITCDNIDVTFTTLEGTTRRPVVHTCGPSLELPSTYQCYNELQEEFTALLHDKESWSFNIV